MIESLPRNILRFVILVLLQVFIFNNIQINGYLNPYIYVLFIILLPFNTPKWMLLVLSFFMGFTIDLFTQTAGMHAMASVFAAFVRPLALNVFSPRDGYTNATRPRVADYGLIWFLKYAGILILMHHFMLFYVEAFGTHSFFITLGRVILSALFTLVIIAISQLLLSQK